MLYRPMRRKKSLVCNQSQDVSDNVTHPRQLDPTMELITYSFLLYLQHGCHEVICKPSISLCVYNNKGSTVLLLGDLL